MLNENITAKYNNWRDEAGGHLVLYCTLSPATELHIPLQLTGTAAFPLELKLHFPQQDFHITQKAG